MSDRNLRRALIASIKISQKQLKLDDFEYRAALKRIVNKNSCTLCTLEELKQVADVFKKVFHAQKSGERKNTNQALMGKLRALVLHLGVSWAYAQGAAKKMFQVDSIEELNRVQLHKLVAALQIAANRQTNKSKGE